MSDHRWDFVGHGHICLCLLHRPFAFDQVQRAIDWKRATCEARGTMGMRQTKRLSRFLLPLRAYLHIKRDAWVQGSICLLVLAALHSCVKEQKRILPFLQLFPACSWLSC